MNPIEQLLQQLVAAGGTTSDFIWCIDEGALARHVASRRPLAQHEIASRAQLDYVLEVSGDIALIHVEGVMMKDVRWSDEVSTPAITEALRVAAADKAVEAIVLLIDSPGGSVAGLVQLAEAMAEARAAKPVVAQSVGMIASAAYYLSAGANEIYAPQGDLVGSIGTRLMVYDFSQMFANLGIEAKPIDTGPLKSTGALGTKLSEEQEAYLQKIVDGFQSGFQAAVMEGRKFDQAQFEAVASGGVFHVGEAKSLGLIDGIRNKTQTLAAVPRRSAGSTKQRSKAMSEETNEPRAATLPELKKALPKASNDFLVEQLGAEATLEDARAAWTEHLTAENERLAKEKEEAEAKTAEAEKKAAAAAGKTGKGSQQAAGKQTGGSFGTPAGGQAEDVDPSEATTDYYELAHAYQKEHKCRWSEACHEIKKRHPGALQAFGGPK